MEAFGRHSGNIVEPLAKISLAEAIGRCSIEALDRHPNGQLKLSSCGSHNSVHKTELFIDLENLETPR
nr:hypothetical protein Itr_chr14CG27070 [Ipomoea trifida]